MKITERTTGRLAGVVCGIAAILGVGAITQTNWIDQVRNKPFVDVRSSGAKGDGTTDDTVAIQAAIDSLSATGGEVRFPAGTYRITSTVNIGNGTSSAASTRNNVGLVGVGAGNSSSETTAPNAATKIVWAGSASGTMFEFKGPISGVRMRDIFLSCGNFGSHANTAILANHVFNSHFADLEMDSCGSYAIKDYAYDNPTGVVIGANNVIWDNVSIYSNGVTTASGVQIGAASDANPAGSHLDVAKQSFRSVNIGAGSSGTAIDLRFTDNIAFDRLNVTSGLVGIKVTQVVSNTFKFPQASACYLCNIVATTPIDDSTWTGTVIGMMFLPYNNDQDLLANPVGTNGWSTGFGTDGRLWGRWKSGSTLYTASTSSSAIASTATETAFSKSYVIPANHLGAVGTILRVRASGKYSTTGTPALSLYFRIGGTGVDGNIISSAAFTTASSVSNYGWSATADLIVRAVGLSGTAQMGYSNFGLGGTVATSSATSGTFTLATTVANTLYATALWGTSSASNTITMDTLQVEIINPAFTN